MITKEVKHLLIVLVGKCVADISFEAIVSTLALFMVSAGAIFTFLSTVFCHSCLYFF